MILRLAVLCTLVTTCSIIGFIVYSSLTRPTVAEAAVTKYYSINNGDWLASIWSDISNTGASCSCNPTCNLATPALIRNKLTVGSCGSFVISGGVTVDINTGGNLTINAPFTLSGGSTINLSVYDTIIVNGNTTLSGGSSIIVNGYMIINGNLTLTGSSSICGSGQGYVTGTKSGRGWCFTGTLPIQLSPFTAQKTNSDEINLQWTTESEINNDYFTIERSSDGIAFETITKQKGAGNSTQKLFYSFIDKLPFNGKNYYRLKQTDYDGKFTFSQVVFVQINQTKDKIILYPNPSRQNDPLFLKVPENY
jgi:hypothetical protein